MKESILEETFKDKGILITVNFTGLEYQLPYAETGAAIGVY